MSVPSHTRNDGHVFYDYEKMVDNVRATDSAGFQNLLSKPVFFGGAVNGIAGFFDTDQYTINSGPDNAADLSVDSSGKKYSNIGLSEYTNANFLSEDTKNSYTYPAITKDTPIVEITRNTTYPRRYYLKNCCGETNNGQGYLLSAVDYLAYYREQYPLLSFALPGGIPVLDDNVYQDYAALLLPRAVGYSASLIDYFFRGQIDMKPDANTAGQYVIENHSDEEMTGTFSLYYDDMNGNRLPVQGATWYLTINAAVGENPGKSSSLTFMAPSDIKEKGKYILVFEGKLGNEDGAVAGKVVSLQKEFLIIYKVSGEYKTFNTKTKETKPYTGIFSGVNNIIWREDGRAALARYGSYWYQVDLDTGTKTYVPMYGNYKVAGGWRGQIPVMLGLDMGAYGAINKIVYWEGNPGSGTSTNYNPPTGMTLMTTLDLWGMVNRYRNMAATRDGNAISFIGEDANTYGGRDYYLVSFDTVNKTFTNIRLGGSQTTYGAQITFCDNWITPSVSMDTNNPMQVSSNGSDFSVFYKNAEVRSEAFSGSWNPSRSCYNLGYTSVTGTYSYGILGTTTSSSYSGAPNPNPNNVQLYPMEYAVLADGKEVIPFVREERVTSYNASSNPPSISLDRVTPCVQFAEQVCANSIEMERASSAYVKTGAYSVVNMSADRSMAVGFLLTNIYGYYPSQTLTAKTVFYTSDAKLYDITNENPDFLNADFLMFSE